MPTDFPASDVEILIHLLSSIFAITFAPQYAVNYITLCFSRGYFHTFKHKYTLLIYKMYIIPLFSLNRHFSLAENCSPPTGFLLLCNAVTQMVAFFSHFNFLFYILAWNKCEGSFCSSSHHWSKSFPSMGPLKCHSGQLSTFEDPVFKHLCLISVLADLLFQAFILMFALIGIYIYI